MECNRDEAIRAKTIAEGKLANKDFAGAKKFSLKAQALYPGLEGLSQMLTTLDVYISAENKVSGEVDWYGVLGVNPSDDDETIRKQYRKLALMLHPDKNKSVGADGAFKLLSEAWSLLSDKARRVAYNQRRSSRGIHQKVTFQSGGTSAAPGPGVNGFNNFTHRAASKPKTRKNTAATRMGPTSVPPLYQRTDTFWTICHRCKMHYEYLKVYLNHTLLCPNCQEPFLASEMPPPVNFPKPSAHQQHQNSSNHGPSSNPFDPGRNHNLGGGPSGLNSSNKHSNVQWSQFSRTNVAGSTAPSIAAKAANVVQQVNERLKREREESYAGWPSKKRKSEDDGQNYGAKIPYQMSLGNGGASTVNITGINGKINSTRELTPVETRNMLMHKARGAIQRKLSKWRSHATNIEKMKVKKEDIKFMKSNSHNLNAKKGDSSSTKSAEEERQALAMNVPDPDFHNFDLGRTENSFQDNQVWAGYDDDDGMPRFYAMIHKVVSRNPFKMKISWLNSKTNFEFGPIDWIGSGFSKTCGEFRVGKHEVYNSLNSFSHKVEWMKGARGTVLIFPRKGDVWALYRNWSPDWNEHIPDDVIHKYDMVEVLDDYNEEQGVSVIPLVKVSGFRTVFHPHLDQGKVKRIPKEEMFRFSHRVPKYLLTGEEAHNAPKGCLELDPAATPLDLLQVKTEAVDQPSVIEDDATKAKEEEMVENGEETKERIDRTI